MGCPRRRPPAMRSAMSPVPPARSSRREATRAPRRLERGDQRILPGAVQPARHEVVHQIVALRHLAKHIVDQRLLLAERHPLEAEGVVRRAARAITSSSSVWRGP